MASNDKLQKLKIKAEQQSNAFALKALRYMAVLMIFILFINEIGIFQVPKMNMRIGMLSGAVVYLLNELLMLNKKYAGSTKVKYVIMASSILISLMFGIFLTFHAPFVYLLPVFVSSLYMTKGVVYFGVGGALLTSTLAELIAYYIGTWANDFLLELLERGLQAEISLVPHSYYDAALFCLLYIAFPRDLVIIGFSTLSIQSSRVRRIAVENQYQALKMSEYDTLTGLKNRNSYENLLASIEKVQNELAIIYTDVNGLHELNNSKGHTAGDIMLKDVADSLSQNFGTDNCYRVGGDEFVCVVNGVSEDKLVNRIKSIELDMDYLGYSVSTGMCFAEPGDDIHEIVKLAEKKMYVSKNNYYKAMGQDMPRRSHAIAFYGTEDPAEGKC